VKPDKIGKKHVFFWDDVRLDMAFFAGIDWKLNETRPEDFVAKLQDHWLSKVQNL